MDREAIKSTVSEIFKRYGYNAEVNIVIKENSAILTLNSEQPYIGYPFFDMTAEIEEKLEKQLNATHESKFLYDFLILTFKITN